MLNMNRKYKNSQKTMNHSSSKTDTTKNKLSAGFSLIELMIVVAIIGVIASTSISAYSSYTVRANRSDAQDALTEVMFQMERFYTRNRIYTLVLDNAGGGLNLTSTLSRNGMYNLAAVACPNGAPITRCVEIQATPTLGLGARQTFIFGLDSRNQRRTYNPDGSLLRNDWNVP